MDDVAMGCRCGNVSLCLRAPLIEVDLRQLPQAVPLGLHHQRLGVADLISVFHRVPELVRASERLSDRSSAKWRCYECRICRVEVYACRIGGESQPSNPLEKEGQIVTEGILLNLELAAATVSVNLPLTDKKEESYSHVFRVDLSLVSVAPAHSTDISKLLGAAGVDGVKLFERLTNEVDSWFAQHLRDLAFTDGGEVTKEQEASIRRKALRERDIIFSKICQENGIGGDLASLARAAEALGSAINKGTLLMGDDDDMDDDGDFEARCHDLEEFKERYGHCRVPRGWRENVNLSNWVRNLRRKKIRGTLTSEKIAKLEELGFVWRKERKDSWEEHFAQLIEFKERFGHCRVSRNWKENIKLGQWVQSLRRLKLSGRLADDKIARLESIGFEWRLRQKEDGSGHEFRDGEQVDTYDDHSADSEEANSDEDFVASENAEPTQTKSEARTDRWSYQCEMSPTKGHQPFAYYDGLRMEGLTTTKSSASTTTTTTKTATVIKSSTTTTAMRKKMAKVRLPRSPTFSLNDLDETLHEKYGHAKYDYDDDDDDDEEFDAALDDEEEDGDWEDGSRSTSRAKRKRTKEKPKGRRVSHDSDKRLMSPLANKSGVRACVECGATKTPHWRRGPSDKHGDPAFLCNACGLRYYKTLQQKSSGKKTKKKEKRTSKKQKTHRVTGSHEEALPASPESKREAKQQKKKKKKKGSKDEGSEETTIVPEAVTDSDSESIDEHIVGRFTTIEKSAITTHQEEATAAGEEDMAQAAGGENAHMPWRLAFKQQQQRKDGLTTTGAAARDQPTATAHDGDTSATWKEDEDETFDFVE